MYSCAAGHEAPQTLLNLRYSAGVGRMTECRAHDRARRTADGEASDAADDLSPKHGTGLTRGLGLGDMNKRDISPSAAK